MATSEQDRWVQDALGLNPAASGTGRVPSPLLALPALWADAERRVNDEIEALRDGILAEYGDDPAAKDAEAGFETHVQELMRLFDGKMSSAFTKAASTSDKQTGERVARAAIAQCQKMAAGDKTIALFDSNPFVHVDIAGSLNDALATMTRTLG